MGSSLRAPGNRDRGTAQWEAVWRLVRVVAARGDRHHRRWREFDRDREEIPRSGAKAVGRQRLFVAKTFYSKDSWDPTTAAPSIATPQFRPKIQVMLHIRGYGGRG